MSSNPNRQRLMSPLDYLAALAGAKPPEQEPAWAPGTDPRQMGQQGPVHDVQFHPGGYYVTPIEPSPTPFRPVPGPF